MEYIVDDNKPDASLVSVIGFLLCPIVFFVILGDLYSSFCQVRKSLLNVSLYVWGVCADSKCSSLEVVTTGNDRNTSRKLPENIEMMTQKLEQVSASDRSKSLENRVLTIGEVKTVLSKLGTPYDPDVDKLRDEVGSKEITALFEEQEPSLEEVKEAFSVFDENNDGVIDVNELRKVVATLCFAEASEANCRKMIKAFDVNRDGVIDFQEFLRLVANSFG